MVEATVLYVVELVWCALVWFAIFCGVVVGVIVVVILVDERCLY